MRFYTGATINTVNVNVNRIFVFNHKEKHSHQARQVLLILLKCVVFSVVGDFFFIDACSKSSENTFDTSALSQELSIIVMMMI